MIFQVNCEGQLSQFLRCFIFIVVHSGIVALLQLLSLIFVLVMCHNQFADLRRFAAHAVKRLPLLQVHLLLGCSSHLQRPNILISFTFMFTTFETNRMFHIRKRYLESRGVPLKYTSSTGCPDAFSNIQLDEMISGIGHRCVSLLGCELPCAYSNFCLGGSGTLMSLFN